MKLQNAKCLMPILAILLSTSAFAFADGDRPIEMLFNQSIGVVEADVVEISASCVDQMPYCRPEYFIQLANVRDLKASNKDHEARFTNTRICTVINLEVGSKYILFIEKPSQFNSVSNSCKYAIDKDGVIEKRNDSAFRVGSPYAKITIKFEGHEYWTDSVEELDFDKFINSTKGDD